MNIFSHATKYGHKITKANCQKERITLSKFMTTVFELDTVHMVCEPQHSAA